MFDCGGDQRRHILGRPGAKKAPPKTGKKNEPGQKGGHETPDEAGNQVIAGHRNTEDEENGGIAKC